MINAEPGRTSPLVDEYAVRDVDPKDVRVRLLRTTPELQRAEVLLRDVWGGNGGDPPLALDVMCALAQTGGYVAAAYSGATMIGVTAAFRTMHGSLHSHVAGVLEDQRGRGVGRAMKLHQRDWASEHGLTSISWTFDPLIRRNAYFNLNRLGAVAESYVPDFYGPLSDGINDGDLTDRLFVAWSVTDHPSRSLLPDLADIEPLLDVGPREEPLLRQTSGAVVRCGTPTDAEALRRQQPELGRRWRAAMRDTLGDALGDGYQIFGFHPSGWYLLRRQDASA